MISVQQEERSFGWPLPVSYQSTIEKFCKVPRRLISLPSFFVIEVNEKKGRRELFLMLSMTETTA